jgi:hypothetical protein
MHSPCAARHNSTLHPECMNANACSLSVAHHILLFKSSNNATATATDGYSRMKTIYIKDLPLFVALNIAPNNEASL